MAGPGPSGQPPASPSLLRHAQIACVYLAVAALAVLAYTARSMLVLIFVGFFLALGVEPVVAWLQRHRWRRGMAITAVILAVVLLVGAVVLFAVVPAIGQLGHFAAQLPDVLSRLGVHLGDHRLRATLDDPAVHDEVRAAVEKGAAFLASALGAGFAVIGSLLGGIFAACTAGALLVYFSLAMPRLQAAMTRAASHHPGRPEAVLAAMSRVGGYVTGQALVSLCAGAVSFVFFLIAGIPYPALLALVVAALDAVPQIGATLASVAGILVALSQSLSLAVITLLFFICYQAFENYLIAPRVFARTVELSPLAAFVAILLGGSLAGVLGALIALPITAALKVLYHQARTERAQARPST
ncbi:Predicted PurR-regulated permease PerM [Saccharopolyspora kobensis]|uniref:Predicted PurR-regulated permease PerM n=1 Tax=Saccharopolyspora kobensis TaxID=146035 RepID=A0A1H6EJ42_9PSEU|nr:AI-2E family transporter [Saccharopolyspora kobensis]SEG97898.1 Predicted PurR-regulated permease PerM [Saccharopolyspora kobensis]SFF23808.1 Predicted PurR-regulated permease PerM [Saccharopolyspora kobensis]